MLICLPVEKMPHSLQIFQTVNSNRQASPHTLGLSHTIW